MCIFYVMVIDVKKTGNEVRRKVNVKGKYLEVNDDGRSTLVWFKLEVCFGDHVKQNMLIYLNIT